MTCKPTPSEEFDPSLPNNAAEQEASANSSNMSDQESVALDAWANVQNDKLMDDVLKNNK